MTSATDNIVDTIEVRQMSATIGAMISGVDLATELNDATVAVLRQALLDWKVIFFRDQDITTEQHLAFGRRFGELEVHPFAPAKPGYPEVLAISHDADGPGYENLWHSDVTWRLQPSLGSVLRNVESPDVGGDTLFADMYAAYDGLPQRVRTASTGSSRVTTLRGFAAASNGAVQPTKKSRSSMRPTRTPSTR